jgi:hypothetical protein
VATTLKRDSQAPNSLAFRLVVPAPPAGARQSRQTKAIKHAVDVWEATLRQFSPDEVQEISDRIERSLTAPAPTERGTTGDSRRETLAFLYEGYTLTPEQAAAHAAGSLVDYYKLRHQLLADSLTAPQVAALLGVTRQTPHDRVKDRKLLAVMDRGKLRFPVWQFDPREPNGVLRGVPQVLRALRTDPLAAASWMVRPNAHLDGKSPLQVLRDGDVDRVLCEAQCVERTP